ncbi:hypothetical protein, partial [Pseudomonas syringae]|uniref:hypothetical protein n=1 Tax=Pseudomonas syringae TaxID=317 RepID=UPI001F3F0084
VAGGVAIGAKFVSSAASSAARTVSKELAVNYPGRRLPSNEFVTTDMLTTARNARNARSAAVPEIPPEFPAAAPAKPFSLEKFYRKNPAHMRAVIARNSGYDAAKIRSNHGRPGDWDKFFQW